MFRLPLVPFVDTQHFMLGQLLTLSNLNLAPTVLCNNFENKKFQFDAEFFIKSEKCHCVTVKDVMITKRGKKKIFLDFQVCPNE